MVKIANSLGYAVLECGKWNAFLEDGTRWLDLQRLCDSVGSSAILETSDPTPEMTRADAVCRAVRMHVIEYRKSARKLRPSEKY